MRALLALLASAGLLALMALAIACGGSSSETPWPVEPLHPVLDPAGESAAAPAIFDSRADAGAPSRPK